MIPLTNETSPDIDWMVVSNIFYFYPYLGKIPNLTNIFQRGWNHQPVDVQIIWEHVFDSLFPSIEESQIQGFSVAIVDVSLNLQLFGDICPEPSNKQFKSIWYEWKWGFPPIFSYKDLGSSFNWNSPPNQWLTPRSLTARPWNRIVGIQLLSLMGWYIFRGYVKLPGVFI